MQAYDALNAPPPKDWNEMDEQERMALIQDYHYKLGDDMPNPAVHAVIHTTVENQLALGAKTPIQGEFERLMCEGLDRHEAIHAIGCVLAEHLFGLLHDGTGDAEAFQDDYLEGVREMTAEKWRAMGKEEPE